MLTWHEVPQTAVAAFEKCTRLSLCIHDLAGNLRPYLSPEYSVHYPERCQRVKSVCESECVRCDAVEVRRACAEHQEGFLKICHAGFLEWVMPVFGDFGLMWVIFAGQRRPPRAIKCTIVHRRDPRLVPLSDLPPADAAETDHLLEMLRQLAARLKEWRASAPASQSARGEPLPTELQRRLAIRHFIHDRYHRPISLVDLAAHLHLSVSRTAHLVRETCGMSFCGLVREERLRQAAGLLRCTDLSILEVALRSGFSDLSHFHRLFRRRFQISPRQYRRQRDV